MYASAFSTPTPFHGRHARTPPRAVPVTPRCSSAQCHAFRRRAACAWLCSFEQVHANVPDPYAAATARAHAHEPVASAADARPPQLSWPHRSAVAPEPHGTGPPTPAATPALVRSPLAGSVGTSRASSPRSAASDAIDAGEHERGGGAAMAPSLTEAGAEMGDAERASAAFGVRRPRPPARNVRRCGACASAASRSAYAAERLSGDSRAAHAIGLRCGCECSPASATVADGCRRGCA